MRRIGIKHGRCEPEGRACTPKCLPSRKRFVRASVSARRRGNLVFLRLLRPPHQVRGPRNDNLGNSFRSLAAIIAIVILFAFPSVPQAAPREVVHSLTEELETWNVEKTWTEVKGLLDRDPKDSDLVELASLTAFYRGDYQEAQKLMKAALALGGEDEKKKGFALFLEETIGVTAPFKKYESPHFVISLDENQDVILADYLMDTLERTYQIMAEKYGFQPKQKIRIEVFPDAKTFSFASTLSARDIEVTGAVGLAKFNKLMVLSPKALVYGYRWLDAISHEFMHYVIVRLTANKAPIWFHEGLAKYEETRWRNGSSYLSSLYQTLLARALADGKLITFGRMEPSLIKLETPEDVQLAYAQAALAIDFIISKVGHEGLKRVMTRMATSRERGASEAIQEELGLKFEEFENQWKEYLVSKGLKEVSGVHVHRYKITEGRADEERLDMSEIKSMISRNRAHLGDLLNERGRREAAVMEYRRALADANDSVPVMNRLSNVLIALGKDEEALEMLKRAEELSPDHPNIYTNMGKIYLKSKDYKRAEEAFQNAIQISPYNPEIHFGLATALEVLGNKTAGQKEREIGEKLRR
jgi:tetratricopeptide (TPR) repeat protein